MKKIGFYAGSFDPFTNGHLQIVRKAAECFEKVIVGIAYNSEKKVRLDKEKMKQAIEKTIQEIGLNNVEVALYKGLTAEEAKMLAGFPCNNIVLLAAKPLPDIPWSYYIKPNMRYQYPYTYLGKNIFGVCHFEREFDYVSFLNKK